MDDLAVRVAALAGADANCFEVHHNPAIVLHNTPDYRTQSLFGVVHETEDCTTISTATLVYSRRGANVRRFVAQISAEEYNGKLAERMEELRGFACSTMLLEALQKITTVQLSVAADPVNQCIVVMRPGADGACARMHCIPKYQVANIDKYVVECTNALALCTKTDEYVADVARMQAVAAAQ